MKSPAKLPEHIQRLAPKRADFETDDEYEEAVAFFRHRFRHLAK
jgi:hypothetical protein